MGVRAALLLVAGLLLPAAARGAAMEVRSGSYVGNGTDDRSLFVGFQPDVVFVKRDGAFFGVVKTSTMPGDSTKSLDFAGAALFANGIQSLTATGFVVGTNAQVNAAAATYHWVAFKAAPGELKVGTYVGNATDNRSITGVGFQPDYVITLPAAGGAAGTPLHRSSTMLGDTTYDFDATEIGPPADAIQAMEVDGFQIGLLGAVNTNNATYHYIAWRAVAGSMAVGTYAGDGADNRPLDVVGFMPEWVIVKRDGDLWPFVQKPASTGVATDYSLFFSNFAGVTDAVQVLRPLGFEVGTHARVNENLATYHWVAFGPRAAATVNYRSIGTAAAYGTGTISVTTGSNLVTGAGTSWRLGNRGRGDVLTIPCPDPPTCTGGVHYTVASVATDTELQLTQGYVAATASGVTYLLRRQFSTLAAWEDCVDGGAATCVYFPVGVSGNLVTDDRSEVGIAYKDSVFTAGLIFDGTTTDATHTITLTADPGNRHYGVAGTGVVVDIGASAASAIRIQDDWLTVEWMETKGGSGVFAHGIEVSTVLPGAKQAVRNNLIHNMPGQGIRLNDADTDIDIYNNIIYENGVGIRSTTLSQARVFNNTVYGNNDASLGVSGIRLQGGTSTLRNNIAHSNAGGDFAVAGLNAASSNNLASDTSGTTHSPAGGGLNSVPLANLLFVSTTAGSENLHIQGGSAAENNGADLSAVFTNDIDDEARRVVWDRGADDVRAVVNYRSIGSAGPYNGGTANATMGSTTVTGTGTAWLANNRGRGDVITIPCPSLPACAGGTNYTILGVSADNQLTLTTPFAGATGPYTYAIRRQFSTLAAWETCIDGPTGVNCTFFPASVASASLVTDDRSEVGIAYKDSDFTGPSNKLDINGSITDALHTITLTADPGNRHLGVANGGVVVDGGAASTANILVQDDHVTVEWLEIKRGLDEGIEFQNLAPGNKVVARNLLVHDTTKDGILVDDADAIADVYNNIVYNTAGTGAVGLGGSALTTGTIRVFNNTVYNGSAGGIIASGTNPGITLANNIAHSNGGLGDYRVTGLNASSRNNLASNGSGTTHSPAGGGLNSVPLANLMFVSTTPGSENLHIQAGSAAENNGADLRAFFNVDIDGAIRQLPWDRGADDIGATTAVTLQSFEARGLDSAVDLTWQTSSELDNLGFHLYRASAAEGPYERITTSIIPGLGSSPVGASYGYRDLGLTNGVTYFYRLEDVETTGETSVHGPVQATPQAGAAAEPAPTGDGGGGGGGSGGGDEGGGSPGRIAHGEPGSNALRVIRQDPTGVVVELVTRGFYATPRPDGSVGIEIPGFVEVAAAGAPSLPVRRVWVEAWAGRGLRLAEVEALERESFEGVRPEPAWARGLEVSAEGTVRLGRTRTREGESFRRGTSWPRARLLEVAFQGEVKKAHLELSPLHWDATAQRLELARRLVVRLSFGGEAPGETGRGGGLGRKASYEHGRRSGVMARLGVRQSGLYRVSFEEVMEAGASALALSRLRLSRQGEAVAFHVEPQTGLFAPGSALYFLSEGAELNPYGVEAVYELEQGGGGETMEVAKLLSTHRRLSSTWAQGEWEENKTFQAGLIEAEQIWLWQAIVSPATKSFPFTLSGLAGSTEPSTLRVSLQGGSDFAATPDHHVRVSVNGVEVGEASWEGKAAQVLEAEVPAGVLLEGANQLSIQNVGDTGAAYSLVFLDRFTLIYPRTLAAEGGVFRGSFRRWGAVELTGVGPEGIVLDTTEAAPRWLEGAVATRSGLAFAVEAGRSYAAVDRGAVLRPQVRRARLSWLTRTSNRAEYLLVGPGELLGAAEPLLERRRAEGLLVQVVPLEQVWDEFGHGEPRPQALREFLSYAYHRWSPPSPRYVLLLGDASFDFKDYLGLGQANHVPPLMVRTSYLWTASDPTYAAVNGEDDLPDIAIGRLSAGSPTEAEALIAKLLAFEDTGLGLSGRAVLVADNADQAGNFEANTDEIAATLLADREVEKIYLRDYGSGTRGVITDSLDRGASLLSYVGHGGVAVWASENVFNNLDVATLTPQPQQPFLLTMNCLNGYFHMPGLNSLSEELVKAEGKGAIGAFSPSGLSIDSAAHAYHRALISELVSGRHQRLGDAVLAAQAAYNDSGQLPELLQIYHLLADPALKLRP